VVLLAALLVLTGLGLFVLGVLTAVTAWYWACVAACGVAAVLLVLARRQAPAAERVPDPWTDEPWPARSGPSTAEGPVPRATGPATGATGTGRPAPEGSTRRSDEPEAPDDRPRPAGLAGTAGRPPAAGRTRSGAVAAPDPTDPPEEDVEVTELLMVVDLADEVLVVDEHPRYHLTGCRWLGGRGTIPLPVREARSDGFTPCAVCAPDAALATAERARRARRT
jgi:hypothetical protein